MKLKFVCTEGGKKKAKCDGVCMTSEIIGSHCCFHLRAYVEKPLKTEG